MKIKLWISSILLCLLSHSVGAAHLYWVMFVASADETSPSIDVGSEMSKSKFLQLADDIDQQTSLDVVKLVYEGADFSPQVLEKRVKPYLQDHVKEGDKVCFIFIGHGFRFDDDVSPWPNLLLYKEAVATQEALQTGRNLGEIHQWIVDKTPASLVVSLSESCNDPLGVTSDKIFAPSVEEVATAGMKPDYQAGLQVLFEQAEGEIMMSTASAGEESYIHTKQGGYGTNAVLNSLQREVKKGHLSGWKSWLGSVNEELTTLLASFGGAAMGVQTFQYHGYIGGELVSNMLIPRIYTVRNGYTNCYFVADTFQITVAQLKRWNDLPKLGSTLKKGQKLIVGYERKGK